MLVPDCTYIVHVTCPPIQCGISALTLSRSKSRRSNVASTPKTGQLDTAGRSVRGVGLEQINSNNAEDQFVGIVGGRASHQLSWPFVVDIVIDAKIMCSGTIISELWVLSAAHCYES